MERILGVPIPYLGGIKDRLAESPIAYRLARGAFWSLLGAVISRGLGLISSILVARMLGKQGFGELGIIQSTIGMFGTFAGFGLGLTATKYIAELRQTDPQRVGRIMAFSASASMVTGGLMTVLLFALAPWLAERTLAAPHLAGLVRVAAILLFLGAVTGTQTGALAGFEAFRSIARVNLLAGVFTFPLIVGGVYLAGLEGAIWGLAASMGVNWLLNHLTLKAEARSTGVPFSFSGCIQEYKVLWNFSLPAVLSSAMVGPVNWACSAILVNQPNGYAEMGVFNAANQWRTAILFLPGALGSIALPVLANLQGKANSEQNRKVFWWNVVLNEATVLLGAVPVAILAPCIMASYGEGFAGAYPVLILLLLSAVILSPLNVIGQSIVSKGQMWWAFFLNTLWAIVLLFSFVILCARGALGLAWAYTIAYGFHLFFVSTFSYLIRDKY